MAKKKAVKLATPQASKDAATRKLKNLLIDRLVSADHAQKQEKYNNDVIVSRMISKTNEAKGGPRKNTQQAQMTYTDPKKVTNKVRPSQVADMKKLGVSAKDAYGFSRYVNAANQNIRTGANSSAEGFKQHKYTDKEIQSSTQRRIKGAGVRAGIEADPETKRIERESIAKRTEAKKKKKSFVNDFMDFWKGTVGGDEDKIKNAIGSTGEKLDKSDVYKETNRLTNRLTNRALLDLPNALNKQATGNDHASRQKRENPSLLGTIADGAADMAGYLVPGTAAYKAVNATKLGKAAKGATDVVRAGGVTAKNVAKAGGLLGAQGAAAGGAVTGAEEIVKGGINPEDFNAKDAAKRIALGTALGAVADPVLGLIGPLAKGTVNQGVKSQQNDVLKMIEQMKGSAPTGVPARNNAARIMSELVDEPVNSATRTTANRGNVDRVIQEMQSTPNPQRELIEAITSGGTPKRTQAPDYVPMKRIQEGTNSPVRDFEPITSGGQRSSANPLTEGLESNVPIQTRGQFPDAESAKAFLETAPSPVADVRGPVKLGGIQKKLASKTTGAERAWVDRAVDSKKIVEHIRALDVENRLKINKIGDVEFADNLYKQARQLPYSHNRAVRSADKTYNPILQKLNKSGITKKQFDDFSVAMHANDILQDNATKNMSMAELQAEFDNLRGLDTSSMSVAEYKDVTKQIKEMRSDLEDLNPYNLPEHASPDWVSAQLKAWEGNTAMAELHQEFIGAQAQRLQMLRQSGDISEEVYERLITTHPNYVSMTRDIPEGGFKTQGGQNIVGTRKEGSTDLQIKSPTDMAIRNHMTAIKRMERNEFGRTIAKYAEIDDMGELFRQVDAPTNNSITTMVDGVPQHYEVPEYLSSYLSNLTKQSEDDVVKSFAKSGSRYFKKMTTHWNPAHHVLAAARETTTNAFNSNTGNFYTSIGYDIPMGYLDAFFGKNLEKLGIKSFKDAYVDQAGNMSQYVATEDTAIREMAEGLVNGRSPAMKGVDIVNPLKWIEKLGEVGEQGPRLGMMRQATRKGLSDKDAFFEGINLHDHQKAGNVGKRVSQYVPYFNSAIQGNARLLEGMATKPLKASTKMITRATVGIVAPTVALRLLWDTNENVSDKQKDILKNLQPYQKNMFWHFPNVTSDSDKVYAIPKPPVIGQLFANPVERALDEKMGYVPRGTTPKGTAFKEVGQALAPPDSMALFNTLMELGANRDFFTGYDIESQYDRNAFVPKGEREGFNQSVVGKLLAGGINKVSPVDISPAQVDHTIKKTTGTLGTQALEGSNALAHKISPDKVPANVRPFTDVLGKSFNQFQYDETNSPGMKNKLKQMKAEEGLKMPTTKSGKANFKRQDSAYMFDRRMTELEKEIKEIRKSTELTPEQKKNQISRIRENQRKLGSEATDWYNEYFSK